MQHRGSVTMLFCILLMAGICLSCPHQQKAKSEPQIREEAFSLSEVSLMETEITGDSWEEYTEEYEETEWDENFWEDSEETEEDNLKGKTYGPLGGEDGMSIETYICGDFVYCFNPDGSTVRTVSYGGNDREVAIPAVLDGHPVTAVGEFTFQERENLISAELPEGITEVGNMAFYKCAALTSVSIPEGVITLEQACFGGCGALKEIHLPESLETIGDFAFLACTCLEKIVCGNCVHLIGQGAFQMCTSLKSVILPASLTEIGKDAFADCSPELEILRVEANP